MALDAAMFIKDDGADYETISDVKGREKSWLVVEATHHVESPRDHTTGVSMGQRIHHPYEVVIPVDTKLPKLYEACCTHKSFKRVEIHHFRPSVATTAGTHNAGKVGGTDKAYYIETFQKALIHSIKFYMPHSRSQDMHEKAKVEYVRLSWSYQIIEWRFTDGAEAQDDWSKPT